MLMLAGAMRWRSVSAAARPAMPEPTMTNSGGRDLPMLAGMTLPTRGRQRNLLEAEHAARTALDALAARQAIAAVDGDTAPGMGADIDADRTVVGAAAALDAAGRVGHHLPFGQHLELGSEYRSTHRGTS